MALNQIAALCDERHAQMVYQVKNALLGLKMKISQDQNMRAYVDIVSNFYRYANMLVSQTKRNES